MLKRGNGSSLLNIVNRASVHRENENRAKKVASFF